VNVCILSDTKVWGGAEVHTVGLAGALAGRGHDVSIVALGDDVFRDRLNGCRTSVAVRKPALPRPMHRMGFRECAALVRGLPGDVGVMVRWGLEAGSLALDVAARLRFGRTIAIEHSSAEMAPRTSRRLFGLIPGLGVWWYRMWLTWRFRSMASSRVVAVSETARERLIHDFRLPRRKVVAVRNGIDADRYRRDDAARAAVRRSWGASDSTVVVGSVSRLSPEKGLDSSVAAFARLTRLRPERDVRLVLVGEGDERKTLEKAAREAGVLDRVVFPGFTDRPWDAHSGIDVYLQPSREEAIGLAMMEAMACECYPIATAVGGVPEVLSAPGVGRLTAPGDVDELMAALDEATGLDPERRREIGRAARRHIVERFNAAVQFEALARVIERG